MVNVSINDLPEFLAGRGLRQERAEWGWERGAEPTIYVSRLQPALPGLPPVEQEAKPSPPPVPPAGPSKLALILSRLVRQAAAHPGSVEHHNLFKGLRLDLMVGLDGETRLMIARKSVYPSDAEWVTILSYWPYDPPDMVPEKFEYKQWRCMRAVWPTPEVVQP
jgi:hypothetical protein